MLGHTLPEKSEFAVSAFLICRLGWLKTHTSCKQAPHSCWTTSHQSYVRNIMEKTLPLTPYGFLFTAIDPIPFTAVEVAASEMEDHSLFLRRPW